MTELVDGCLHIEQVASHPRQRPALRPYDLRHAALSL
jgi:hypothetical protein